MTNRSLRSERSGRARRLRSLALPVFVMLEVSLVSLIGIAVNIATARPEERPDLPGPMRWIGQHPWQAVVILTIGAGWIGWSQLHRAQSHTSGPPSVGLIVRQPTLRGKGALARADYQQVRNELLARVRLTWIEGVLNRSLAQVAQIELGLIEQPDAINPPWGSLLHQPGRPAQRLPPGTRISQIAERVNGLLIIGGPGAGKTTLLLEYARDLLYQATGHPQAPVPVVFHLSAWRAEQPSLANWLVSELGLRYGLPEPAATAFVGNDRLAVLLDGLDEVPEDHRSACIQAINAFREKRSGRPLVVCARTREYEELARELRLSLDSAVEVQPLDRDQVRHWLEAADRQLAGLRDTLRNQSHWLWELLDSPLLLSIAVLTYRGQPARAIGADGSAGVLLGAYVNAMLARPRAPLVSRQDRVSYDKADAVRWLAWLADRMGPESVFYPDWMRPEWLPTRRQYWIVTTGLVEAVKWGGGLVAGLIAMPFVGLAPSLFFAIVTGWVGSLAAEPTWHKDLIRPVEQPRWSWANAKRRIIAGLLLGTAGGLAIGVFLGSMGLEDGWWILAPSVGLGTGLTIGLIVILAGGIEPQLSLRPATPLAGIRAAGRSGLIVGLIVGMGGVLVVGFGGGLGLAIASGYAEGVFRLEDVVPAWLFFGRSVGLLLGLTGGLYFGLAKGGATYLRFRLLYALLRRKRLIPSDLIAFLEYADSRILLRRAGGGYLFIHRLLQDHFAKQARQDTKTRARRRRRRPLRGHTGT